MGGATSPRKSGTRLSYDAFGNVTEVVETGDISDPLDDKDTIIHFNPNLYSYIVDRPATVEVYGNSATANGVSSVLLSITHYAYDHSLDYTLEPGSKGELTTILRLNDDPKHYVETQLDYE